LEVEKNPSGSTPSAGSGAKRASGAPANGAAAKSGNELEMEAMVGEETRGAVRGRQAGSTCAVRVTFPIT
jgi:hypothetical protein